MRQTLTHSHTSREDIGLTINLKCLFSVGDNHSQPSCCEAAMLTIAPPEAHMVSVRQEQLKAETRDVAHFVGSGV